MAAGRRRADPPPPKEEVVHPDHYNQGPVECIDAIESMLGYDGFVAWLQGTIVKYQWRMNHKGRSLIDARKASFYQDRLERTIASAALNR